MFKHLQLQKPIVFLDVETTGVDPWHDRIVEVGMVKYAPGMPNRARTICINPECSIPESAFAIHGLADEHVANCPTFAQSATEISAFIGNCDLGGFNISRFDLPILMTEFARVGRQFILGNRRVIDAMTLLHQKEPRNLAGAVRRYCKREHVGNHQALHDAIASARVLDAMLGAYEDVPREVSDLCKLLIDVDISGWFNLEGHTLVFARGKHRGIPLDRIVKLDPSYLRWLRERALPDVGIIIDQALPGFTIA